MKNGILSLLLLACVGLCRGQEVEKPAFNAGFELDALPYLTGGYLLLAGLVKATGAAGF